MAAANDDCKTEKLGLAICNLCNKEPSKYSCPRCTVLYCSVECYKSEQHKTCSEEFYRECIVNELAGYQADPEAHKRMAAFLEKQEKEYSQMEPALLKMINGEDDVEDEDIFSLDPDDNFDGKTSPELDSDDGDSTELHTRIKDIDLDDADNLWKLLNNDERNEFEALVSKAHFDFIIPTWDAWWSYSRDRVKVEEVRSEEDKKEREHMKKCPKLIEVPKFSSMTSVQPSDAIQFNIINVISSYAFVVRYFNGELDSTEAAAYILAVCDNLNLNTNFENAHAASKSIELNCFQSPLIETDKSSLDVMRTDALSILQGPSFANHAYYTRAAFSHLHTIFAEAIAKEKKNISNSKDGGLRPKSPKADEKTAKNNVKSPKKDNSPNGNVESPNGIDENSVDADPSSDKEKTEEKLFSQKFPEHGKEHLPKLDISKIKKVMKKIEYYLSFIESHMADTDKKLKLQ